MVPKALLLATIVCLSSAAARADFKADLAGSLNTDPDYLMINIPPRVQAVPSSVYSVQRWIPIRTADIRDGDLKTGDPTSIDASSAAGDSAGAGVKIVRFLGLSGGASMASDTSVLLPDAHSIEMVEDRMLDKAGTSPEVQNACRRGEPMVIVTKSYQGTPTITMVRKADASAEAFEKAKLNAAQANANVTLNEADKYVYVAKSPIIFAFEFEQIKCDLVGSDGKKTFNVHFARITDTQLASLQSREPRHGGVRLVGGAPMDPDKTIVSNAVNSKSYTTLVSAVKAAGLVDTLQGPGPFTVFAPTNAAFDKLDKSAVTSLLLPSNKEKLVDILKYQVVPGQLTSKDLLAAIAAGGGKADLKTIEGGKLVVTQKKGAIIVTDEKGDTAHVTTSDVMQGNGVLHVTDSVLVPN